MSGKKNGQPGTAGLTLRTSTSAFFMIREGLEVSRRSSEFTQMDPDKWSDVSARFIRAMNHVLDR